MNNTKIISNVSSKVLEVIKTEIANKKERHKKIIAAIDQSTITALKSMKKIG